MLPPSLPSKEPKNEPGWASALELAVAVVDEKVEGAAVVMAEKARMSQNCGGGREMWAK